jgi:transposase
MAGAERRAASARGRATIDWDAAFLAYAALSPEQRTYRTIAEAYGVSARTVETHGRRDRWRDRARELDQQAVRRAERAVARTRSDQITDVLKLIEASLVAYAQQLRQGEVRIVPADLPRLVKLLNELAAEPEPDQPPMGERAGPPTGATLEHMTEVLAALEEVIGPTTTDLGDREEDQQ